MTRDFQPEVESLREHGIQPSWKGTHLENTEKIHLRREHLHTQINIHLRREHTWKIQIQIHLGREHTGKIKQTNTSWNGTHLENTDENTSWKGTHLENTDANKIDSSPTTKSGDFERAFNKSFTPAYFP